MSENRTDSPFQSLQHRVDNSYDADGNEIARRESFALITEHGAVEGWRTPDSNDFSLTGSGYYGGIEIHSNAPMYSWDTEPSHQHCPWTGGPCWHDGSSTAFDQIEPFFDSPRVMHKILTEWAEYYLGHGAEKG